MTIAGSTIFVTGANRGIGRALVDEALSRGAARVFAGVRRPWTHRDPRVVTMQLDVTDAGQIQQAVGGIGHLDLLVNNAGWGSYEDLSDRASLERHLAVNLFGVYDVTHAFLPLLTASGGAVVNVLSVAALASLPVMPAYSISKAATLSLTQALRALLATQGVRVHAALSGPVDTDMVRSLNLPKSSPESVAHEILGGVDRREEDIFPDPMSASLAEGWRTSTSKTLEREFAAFVQPTAAIA